MNFTKRETAVCTPLVHLIKRSRTKFCATPLPLRRLISPVARSASDTLAPLLRRRRAFSQFSLRFFFPYPLRAPMVRVRKRWISNASRAKDFRLHSPSNRIKQPPCTERARKFRCFPLSVSYQSPKGTRSGDSFKNPSSAEISFFFFASRSVRLAAHISQSLFV